MEIADLGIGCYNRGPTVRVLYCVEEVVMALGDTEEVGVLCGVSQNAIRQWRKKKRIPWACREKILKQLAARRYSAVPSLFGPQKINFRSV